MLKALLATVQAAVKTVSGAPDPAVKLEIPPPEKGDSAICCTSLAKQLGKNPLLMAEEISKQLAASPILESATSAGPYVNMRFDTSLLFRHAIDAVFAKDIATATPEQIMVEYLSPNTNKPLHLGHVRNGVLGSTLANLLQAVGHRVVRAELINDRGEHICKSMLAYQMFGEGSTPESSGMKGDHFVGTWYVRYAEELQKDPALKEQVADMLLKWEQGDPDILELWRTMNGWVYGGFDTTNRRYRFPFEKIYFESDLYTLGKEQVEMGLQRGIFVPDEKGALRFPLPVEMFGTSPDGGQRRPKVLNPDGTSVYMTQDIGTAIKKTEDFNLDRSIYVVGSEQDNHFRTLFCILRALGFEWAKKCYHLSYGMVELPEGKMKSREGTVVDADDLADEMAALASAVVREKTPGLADDEVARRAEVIGLAAIKFYLLRFGATSKISFDPKKSLSFDGDTGPYCLYTYARARSVLARAQAAQVRYLEEVGSFTRLTTQEERACALELLRFPDGVKRAAEGYAPAILIESLLALSKAFNRFYKAHHVIVEDPQLTLERLALVSAVAEALRWGFSFLGVVPLEKM